MTTLAILTAAGSGTRLGRDVPKALVDLGGFPLVLHAARRLAASGMVDRLVVTCPAGLADVVGEILAGDPELGLPTRVVEGGATRQASVAAGLRLAGPDDDVVLVHDAARPLAPPELVRRVVTAVRAGHAAVVPGLPVVDTVKRVAPRAPDDAGGAEKVVETPDRSLLRVVQTPQGFERAVLDRAHAEGRARAAAEHLAATDDAGLVEALGLPVHVVPGADAAMKITTERDLLVAGLLAEEAS
ncbi:2-C-methyl-D-erythritol 4-phosphate cytidylyltransferase [Isoptericola sp. NEAU-Y5]|uniref:2-C-methyl-D-erythritol 4-phosphate cytidylyltransferase n=1 Tax=Isoptericola luteus TaxID=2879484 RepID=A0ABS7ZHG6_9MICO|nr:2-C-methyl-D-erythritol 4-phosphate cytidylyltransferase [Isoptericola sp. NEAU-Y5]MCA5893049.1 2-C-methyl-D-erythritol 4-phosphate cytidylyltransferase [Isoptericola sp. NEAU-Y5]